MSVPEFNSPVEGAAFDIRAPRSTLVVVLAAAAILTMAALGFYRGLTSAKPMLAGGGAGATNAVLGAKPAVPMAQNPNWSTLNGPQILPAPTVKAQADDADEDDSDSPDDTPAAANDAPPPPAPAAPTPAKPAPTAQPQPGAADPPPF